jgi:hypothetical protein
MVADANGEPPGRIGKPGERALVGGGKLAGEIEECPPRAESCTCRGVRSISRQSRRSSKRFNFKLTAAWLVRITSAARVKLPSSAMRMKASIESRSSGRFIISEYYYRYREP